MKMLVIGLDCASPDLLFGDERLENVRRLMGVGCFGRLESVIPPITVPAWMCLATGQDPGSLGVYGFRNRADYSYERLSIVDSRSIDELAIWDQVARRGNRSVIVGVPPNYPPRKIHGVSVGCFLTPDTSRNVYTHPAEVGREIEQLVGSYPVDVSDFRTLDKDRLARDIVAMTRKHFAVIRHLLNTQEWDYFQFVEIGLDRIQHGFWRYHDSEHVLHEQDSPYRDVIRDYYRMLDEEIGQLLGLLDDETVVLVVSDHGARRLDGGFCLNEWLIREGLLVLNRAPDRVTPFAGLDVDWSRTRVWGEGGYYGRIFFNVKGREPLGVVDPSDCDRLRNDLKARLEAMAGPDGRPLGTRVFEPREIYRRVRNVAPDLIAHFGGLSWRSIGSVGYPDLFILENDTGPDDCNHDQFGAFLLAGPGVPALGPVEGVHLLDVAPTLLELGGYDVPSTMQGRSLVADWSARQGAWGEESLGDEEVVRERLRGLGYLS